MMPAPVVGTSGNIYFACGSNLMAVSEDGRLFWFKDFSEDTVKVIEDISPDISGLLLTDNRLIVTSCNGKIYSLYVEDSPDDGPWPMFQHDPRRTGAVGTSY